MEEVVDLVNRTLTKLLPESDLPEARLMQAMRSGVLNGGKRLRPFLVIHSALQFNVDLNCARRVAAAIELLHCYSLIHDDLPAMDNADLRRGQPTIHKQYDDATAILAGDALLTLAFEVLSDPQTHSDPHVRCELVGGLAKATGFQGMVGGQMLDLLGETSAFDLNTINRLQRMKTGRLMVFACEAGAILGKASPQKQRALSSYANNLGLAFQVTDDILDVEGTSAETGKDTGKDNAANKATFVSTMGKDAAHQHARMLIDQAITNLKDFDSRADLLRDLALYVLNRRV
jgi:farnesyl diphosphate synthase